MKKGFTLVEIMIIVSVIVLFTSLVIRGVQYKQTKLLKASLAPSPYATFVYRNGKTVKYNIANYDGCEYFMIEDRYGDVFPVHKGNCTNCFPSIDVDTNQINKLEKE